MEFLAQGKLWYGANVADPIDVFVQDLLNATRIQEQKRMKRVKIKSSVDPNDERIGIVIESQLHRNLVEWSPLCRRWEYTANLETYVPPLVVGSLVTVSGHYVTGGDPIGRRATLAPARAKVAYIHGEHAAVIFEHCNTLGTVFVSELAVVE